MTQAVVIALRLHFARYGILGEIVSDNISQFTSQEFATFGREWGFENVASNPYYAPSNGKAENAVKQQNRCKRRTNWTEVTH